MALRAALLLASLYRAVHATACAAPPPAAATTYALITPSPSASPYPVTAQGQLVTSHVPQYAICNPDHSDCTTVYAPTTYAWCSTVVPCYPHSCTVTACTQPITFSHAASYRLASSASSYYVEPVVTRYVLPYSDYAEARYDAVVVERCVGDVCDVGVEHWVEEVRVTEETAVLPVTVHTYCSEPTTVTWAVGESIVVDRPSTVTWVTGSTRTSTLTSTITVVVPYSTSTPKYDATVTVTTDCTSSASATHTPAYYLQRRATVVEERDEFAAYEYDTAGAGKASGEKHSYGQYADHAEAYEYSTSGAGVAHSDRPAVVYVPVEERAESAAYEYDTAGAGKASGEKHSYGQYADHAGAYEYSTSGAGVAHSDRPAVVHVPVEERAESAAYEYDTAGAGKASGEKHSYGQYADHAEAYEYSTSGAGIAHSDRPAVVYVPVEERGESAAYEYDTAGAGKASGEKHSYGQYADHAEAYEYSTSGAGVAHSDRPAVVYVPVEERAESAAYEYDTAGAGKASGEKHSYGQYADHAEAYEYSTSGAGVAHSDRPVVYVPVTVEERAESAAYEYDTAGAGKASGEKHSYGQYADHAEAYEYSTSGAGIAHSDRPVVYVPYKMEERGESIAYEYDTAGAGKASGEKHSYGQYADHAEAYEYSTAGAGVAYSDKPVVAAHAEAYEYSTSDADHSERDEFSQAHAGAGRKSGEVHSYGQYADYSDAYKYREAQFDVVAAKAKAEGELSREASGERHSYGQYQDYEMGVKHEYENEAAVAAGGYGEKGYHRGAEYE